MFVLIFKLFRPLKLLEKLLEIAVGIKGTFSISDGVAGFSTSSDEASISMKRAV